MNDKAPISDATGQTPKERPPFNEVSVLFPLLTFYTVVYLGLIAAEFVLHGAFTMTADLCRIYQLRLGAPGTLVVTGWAAIQGVIAVNFHPLVEERACLLPD